VGAEQRERCDPNDAEDSLGGRCFVEWGRRSLIFAAGKCNIHDYFMLKMVVGTITNKSSATF
jgi:hypothetical protein